MATNENRHKQPAGEDQQSSSSRESSPRTLKKILPATDSDDEAIASGSANSSLGRSPSGGTNTFFLRQPIVSAWGPTNVPAAVSTYPGVPDSINKQFLPGQAVQPAQPPKPAASRAARTSQKDPLRKMRHKNELYGAQPDTWRVKGYSNDPNLPVAQAKHGPYNSSFKASTVPPPSVSPPVTTSSTTSDLSSRPVSNYSASFGGPSELQSPFKAVVAAPSQPAVVAAHPPHDYSQLLDSQGSGMIAPASSDSVTHSSYQSHEPVHEHLDSRLSGHTGPSQSSLHAPTPVQQQQPVQEQTSKQDTRPELPLNVSGQRNLNVPQSTSTYISELHKQPPVHLLSILIEDKRFSYSETLLAEVRVPLRPMMDGGLMDGGFWVDAKDVCDLLQSGPARIDGPAKVFNFRGKYRHCFLRVSTDNKDNYVSTNLPVSSELTLQVVVEPDIPPSARAMVIPVMPHEVLTPMSNAYSASPAAMSTSSGILTRDISATAESSLSDAAPATRHKRSASHSSLFSPTEEIMFDTRPSSSSQSHYRRAPSSRASTARVVTPLQASSTAQQPPKNKKQRREQDYRSSSEEDVGTS